ncbi:glutathione synthetase [Ralstonia solanacearum]|uniref:glutathione synthetase n=1 Tax=Ralstonia solanacearum TaxID=305 RepID=UPI00078EDFF2|nr:glutathione synthetase [Ralstonia solanacearum]AMP39873.1 glutathione synthetase [Ralstonia solanacearum]AXV88716.1 glutathione synthetase [Ralstonia solanacearum]AXW08188.1 glutathione synthetase [Ralstonia solanacearum]AXW25978.1 glutathione synthetase [Ralstonia solanacearum]AXW82888.1 glutathione synthetase [Ralstonia solanacearum]
MNAAGMHAPRCFAFGRGDVPIAFIGGGLILDSGEAENTFVFRCQDRFLVYTSLQGWASLVLVLDEDQRRHYERLLATLAARLQHLAEVHGVSPPRLPMPLYVQCDLRTLSLAATDSLANVADVLAKRRERVFFLTNQVSPTTSRLLRELTGLLRERGVRVEFDAAACEQVSTLALDWHNKARFMAFQRDAAMSGGPPRPPSMVLAPDAFIGTQSWRELANDFARHGDLATPPAELFLKSSQDSSGNVSAILSEAAYPEHAAAFAAEVRRWLLADGFDDERFVQELRDECALPPSWEHVRLDDGTLAALRQAQARRRTRLPLIVQPVLRPPADGSDRPASLGVSLFVDDDSCPHVVAVAAQLYRDAQRRQFVGLYVDDRLLHDHRARALAEQCKSMARTLARHGYRGPVNFDACLGPDDRYWFVGDCNPRLTALYVPLAVRAWLRADGVQVDSVISFGYRGELAMQDVPRCIDAWSGAGLLFSRRQPRGMVILPNLARRDGHDALAVNLDVAQAAAAFEGMRKLAPQAVPTHLQSIYG